MSLVHLVKDAEIRALFDPILDRIPKGLELQLRVPLGRPRARLVGTAFDYAVRFELQRLSPHARTQSWIAEKSAAQVGMVTGVGASCSALDVNGRPLWTVPGELAARYQHLVSEARTAVAAYAAGGQPTMADREAIACHALRLARLDALVRGGYPDPNPERIEDGDLPDLLGLLEIVPWPSIASSGPVWLNPDFGAHSRRVGGADADLISGDRLVDLKTTSKPTQMEDLRQLLGYLILARAARKDNADFPKIARLGVYYARYGLLWIVPAADIIGSAAFGRLEQRFFERADELRAARPEHVTAERNDVRLEATTARRMVAGDDRQKASASPTSAADREAWYYCTLRTKIHNATSRLGELA